MEQTFRIEIRPPQGPPVVHDVDGGSVVIGRSSAADLTVGDSTLSRRHARLFVADGRLMIEDMESHNGTFVNGERVTQPTPLAPGDHVKLSASELYVLDAQTETEPRIQSQTLVRSASELLRSDTSGAISLSGDAVVRHTERLRLLNDVHQALGRPTTLEDLVALILDRVFAHLRPDEAALFLKQTDGRYERVASRPVTLSEEKRLSSTHLQTEVGDNGHALLVRDLLVDPRFTGSQSMQLRQIGSLVAAPLLDSEETLGFIACARHEKRGFREEDMELLVILGAATALRIRNLRLTAEAAERRRLESELALARKIQLALLPQRLPEIPGYELFGMNIPSRGVSGDYYEAVPRLDGRECVLVVADVSGKGMAASLLTTTLEALAVGPIEAGLAPDEICQRLSNRLHDRTLPGSFATAFLCSIDTATGTIRFANAGHNPALLLRQTGELEELAATGLPLGLFPGSTFECGETQLLPGDVLVIYTDGLSEAWNPDDEEYGCERLADLCLHSRELPLPDIAAAIQRDLDAFVRGVPFADDRTLVMARRLP